MKLKLLTQGIEPSSPNAIGNYIVKYLNEKKFNSFIGISAFASTAGISGLTQHIETAKKSFDSITIIVGIDQKGTSKEALEKILQLNINSYIFYQKESSIFHPKIYIFEGDEEIKIIIGSSNLTSSGLFTNIETSILLEFNTDEPDGINLLNEIKDNYKTFFDFSDPNLFKISNLIISNFYKMGITPKEIERTNIYKKHDGTSDLLNIIFSNSVPKRSTARVPSIFRFINNFNKDNAKKSLPHISASSLNITQKSTHNTSNLLWESGPLTERDLNIPKGINTNPTGSMLFKKGKNVGIDQRTYFRNSVFSNLIWAFDQSSKTSHLERSTASFKIIVNDKLKGTFNLNLTHNSNVNSKSFKQNNSMTSLSWGSATKIIANKNLIGKSAKLYNDVSAKDAFVLVIK